MTDYNPVDPQAGWEYDIHSVYTAYLGYFQSHGITWWNQSWGTFFSTFDQFLQFGWPAIVVTDVYEPYHGHIVTTYKNVQAFLKMIRTRFGENLELVPNITKVRPAEMKQRPMRHINDIQFYKKLHNTLPAAELSAKKERVRAGDPYTIEKLWESKEKNFLAVDFEWSEKNSSNVLEFGYAALRSAHVSASGAWPPIPENNYRMGHYVVQENYGVVVNRRFPTFPQAYSFGTTQMVQKRQLSIILQAIIDSLCSPESETQPNDLVLVAHGVAGDLERLAEMKIKIPSNTLILDTTAFERSLFRVGRRPVMLDPTTNQARQAGSTLSLSNLLKSLGVDVTPLVFHNSGNDAFAALVSLQLLLEPETRLKSLRRVGMPNHSIGLQVNGSTSNLLRPDMGGSRQNSDLSPHSRPRSTYAHSRNGSREGNEPAVHNTTEMPIFQSGYVSVVLPQQEDTLRRDSRSDDDEEEEEEEESSSEEAVVPPSPRAPGRSPKGNMGGRGSPNIRQPRAPGRGRGRGRGQTLEGAMKGMNL